MKTPLLIPASAVIVVWVLSSFYSFQKSVTIGDRGWFRVQSGWGSISAYGRKYSPAEIPVMSPSPIKEGVSRYESAYTMDNGRPVFHRMPGVSPYLKGSAAFRRDSPYSLYVSIPYWMLAVVAGIPVAAFGLRPSSQ